MQIIPFIEKIHMLPGFNPEAVRPRIYQGIGPIARRSVANAIDDILKRYIHLRYPR